MTDELPPHSLEAERAVLGSIILDNAQYEQVAEILTPADFYQQAHQILYERIGQLLGSGKAVDFLILRQFLEPTGDLERCGGVLYLSEHIDVPRVSRHAFHYAKIVKEKARLRMLASTVTEVNRMISQGDPAGQIIQAADDRLSAIYPSHFTAEAGIDDLLTAQREYYDRLEHFPADFHGFPTGLRDLDQLTDGLQPSEMTIIAARPSMGKTAFATTLIVNSPSRRIAFFSIEQTNRAILNRMVAKIAAIDGFNLRRGRLDPHEWRKIYSATAALASRPLWIFEDPVSLHQIRARCRKLRASHNLEMVIIDYLGLVRHSLPKNQQHARRDIVTDISHSLKTLAKETGLAVVLLHQLNREAKDGEARPQLHHLRESGDIEADGDLVLFLWDNKGQSTITIGKQRNGPTGDIKVTFLKDRTDFQDYSDRREQ